MSIVDMECTIDDLGAACLDGNKVVVKISPCMICICSLGKKDGKEAKRGDFFFYIPIKDTELARLSKREKVLINQFFY